MGFDGIKMGILQSAIQIPVHSPFGNQSWPAGEPTELNAGESPGIYWIDIWPVDPFMDKSTRILHKQCDITKLHKPDDPKLGPNHTGPLSRSLSSLCRGLEGSAPWKICVTGEVLPLCSHGKIGRQMIYCNHNLLDSTRQQLSVSRIAKDEQWNVSHNVRVCVCIYIYILSYTYIQYIHTYMQHYKSIYICHRILLMLCKPQTSLERRAPGSPASLGSSAFWADLSPSFLGKNCGWIGDCGDLGLLVRYLFNMFWARMWLIGKDCKVELVELCLKMVVGEWLNTFPLGGLFTTCRRTKDPRTRWIMFLAIVKMFWPEDRASPVLIWSWRGSTKWRIPKRLDGLFHGKSEIHL